MRTDTSDRSSIRLMILGTQFEMCSMVAKARKRGWYVVCCDGFPEGPAREMADRDYVEDVRNTDAIARICEDEKINAIITSFSDIMFESMVRIAEKAGIPCYMKPEELPPYRDKSVMRQYCGELGIGIPAYKKAGRKEDMADIGSFPFPAVIKPMDSYGSRGLRVVYSREEAAGRFDDTNRYNVEEHGVLLEEKMEGQELNCQAFVISGKVRMLSIADRDTAWFRSDRIPVQYALIYPSRHLNKLEEPVRRLLQAYVDRTRRSWGPLAMQCFLKDGEIRVCEITGRFFGYEHELTEMTTGLDLESLLLDLADSPEHAARTLEDYHLTEAVRGKKWAASYNFQTVKDAVLADQSEVLRLKEMDGVTDIHLFYKEGEKVGVMGPENYFARVYVQADTLEKLEEKVDFMLYRVHAYDTDGTDVLFHPAK